MSSTEQANRLREEGNCLYKDGKLLGAIHKYQEASKLAPSDSAPLRNLSAVYYEVGSYKSCVTKAEQAISMLRGTGQEDALPLIEKLESRIKKAKAQSHFAPSDDQLRRRRKVLQNLPRYRPNMTSCIEYYTVGHDVADSMFDASFEKLNLGAKQISFLFGGVGDSRHVLRTIVDIAQLEKEQRVRTRRYHITANDINKYAISRDIIVWMLLQDLAETDSDSDEAARILNTLVFVYLATMMPKYAYKHLQETIDRVLSALETGRQPLKHVHLYKGHIPMYIQALKEWKGRALELYTNSEFIDIATKEMRAKREYDPGFMDNTPVGCRKEKLLYIHAAAIYPSRRMLELVDPDMQALLDKFAGKPKANAERFKEHLREHWHVNTTMISPEWYEGLNRKKDYDLSNDPFEAINCFDPITPRSMRNDPLGMLTAMTRPKPVTRLHDSVAPFFIKVANAIRFLDGRLQLEVVLGEVMDVCEKIRFGVYQKEEGTGMEGARFEVRPADFPSTFDRIHMSNVPDYIGGHLSTFLYATPLLKKRGTSIAVSNCLRNTPVWDDVYDYVAEYQCISDEEMLNQLTSVRILHKGEPPHPLADYIAYGPSDVFIKRSFNNLLPRKAFKKWFYALFFKLALPFDCDIREFTTIIMAPLNLSIIFRLLRQLRALSYPAHWLSEVLVSVIDDTVVTSARPPRKLPMRPEDVKLDHPEKKLSTAPFRREVATLAQLFRPLLPFDLPTTTALPPLHSIHAYTFTFPSYASLEVQPANLLLVFYDPLLFPKVHPEPVIPRLGEPIWPLASLRRLLDPSPGTEVDPDCPDCATAWRDGSHEYIRFRSHGVACWSTFTWDIPARAARAWMPASFMEILVQGGWCLAMWRVDIWCPVAGEGMGGGEGSQSQACKVADVMVKGEAWGDV